MKPKTFLFSLLFTSAFCCASAQSNPYRQVDSLMATYTKTVKNTDDLRDLWYFIYQNVYTDSLRLRAAVDWIASNIAYDVKAWQTENEQAGQLDYVLRRKKAVCAGYASLLKYLCDMFKIECEVVTGRARAFDRDVYLQSSKLVDNHAWNVVKINGSWRLLDPTWIAGSVSGEADDPEAKFVQGFTETYCFTPPEKFVLNHYPKPGRHQLLSPAVPEKEFRTSPLFFTPLLDAGIAKVTPAEALLKTTVGDTLNFTFKTAYLPSEMVAWSPTQKKADFKGEPVQNAGSFEFRYPVVATGFYNLFIGPLKGGRGEALLAYKLQVEPKPAVQ